MSQYRWFRHLAALATVGAFAMTGCFVVDDDDDDDGGGEDTGGSGGTGGGRNGAVMKFCNDLARGDESVTLTVEFAGVSASAASGECTPLVPDACIAIPTGANPSVSLSEGATVIITGTFPTLTVAAGDELLVLAAIDDASGEPSVFAETFETLFGTPCASTDPITAVPPTQSRSAPFDMPLSQWNLRNALRPSVSGELRAPRR